MKNQSHSPLSFPPPSPPPSSSSCRKGAVVLQQRQQLAWHTLFEKLAAVYCADGVLNPLQRILVLLPFAQLMPIARRQWAEWVAAAGTAQQAALRHALPPQFETSFNLTATQAPVAYAATDYRGSMAWDVINGRRMLMQAGLDARAARQMLPMLLQACAELAPAVRAVPPSARAQWVQQRQATVLQGMDSEHVRYERLIASVAMLWLGSSAFAADGLFEPEALACWNAMVQVRGIQADALADALSQQYRQATGDTGQWLEHVFAYDCTPSQVRLYLADSPEQEADAATAAVLRCVRQGQMPVALVAQDRALTRRVRSALELRGMEVRDESGWRLSTTPAAAVVVTMLRAAPYQAETVQVLNWMQAVFSCLLRQHDADADTEDVGESVSDMPPQQLSQPQQQSPQQQPALDTLERGLQALERLAHDEQAERWQQLRAHLKSQLSTHMAQQPATGTGGNAPVEGATEKEATEAAAVSVWLAAADAMQQSFSGCRTLGDALHALHQALEVLGVYQALAADETGAQCLTALRLQSWQSGAIGALEQLSLADIAADEPVLQILLQWVQMQLENTNFVPPYTVRAQVTVLPLSQLLGRAFASLVLAGADADRLPLLPDAQPFWSPASRAAFGMPDAQQQAQQMRQAFACALAVPAVALLYSTQRDGQEVTASPLVQQAATQYGWAETEQILPATQLLHACTVGDHRQAQHMGMGMEYSVSPQGLPLRSLSASAYDSLRRCPYQFHARYLLRLYAVPELESAVEKRDYGDWLHTVLADFHRRQSKETKETREAGMAGAAQLLDGLAQQHAPDDARFLPYRLTWEAFRDAYLHWWQQQLQDSRRWTFYAAEHRVQTVLDGVQLNGRIDRVDVGKLKPPPESDSPGSDAEETVYWVMDYKTTAWDKSRRAARDSQENSQLPFYALTLCRNYDVWQVRASYINLSKNTPQAVDVQQLDWAMTRLERGIRYDIGRIHSGYPMYALGAGMACTYCDYQGLCRKPHWDTDAAADDLLKYQKMVSSNRAKRGTSGRAQQTPAQGKQQQQQQQQQQKGRGASA